MSGRQEWRDGGPMGRKVKPSTCVYCNTTFPSTNALRAHKAEKFKEENQPGQFMEHFWCEICDRDFHTFRGADEHLRQYHPHKQDLICPGCDIKFATLSSFIKHIELGQCSRLDIETLQAQYAERMKFARGLARLDIASFHELPNIKAKDFSINLGLPVEPQAPWYESPSLLSSWDVVDPSPWGSSEPVAGKYENNYWAKDENEFPGAAPAHKTTAGQTQRLNESQQAHDERSRNMNTATFDPDSPYFNPLRCWNGILQKYQCPHKPKCYKSFNNKAAFLQHLKSPIHEPNFRHLSCPSCKDSFDTLFALAAHVESQSKKCKMRHSLNENNTYRIFLDQLTLGMVEVEGIHSDFTQKFQLREEFKEMYGPQKASRSTSGQRFSGGGNSVHAGRPGLTEAALSKQQQAIERASPRFMPSERQDYSRRISSGPSMSLIADALSQLQLQEKDSFPGSQNPGSCQQQRQQQQRSQQPLQQLANSWGRPSEPQQQSGGYVWNQLIANGWDTWDQRPEPLEQQQQNGAHSQPRGYGKGGQRNGGSKDGYGW